MIRGKGNHNSFQNYISMVNREIVKSERRLKEVLEGSYSEKEIKNEIEIILASLQICAYSNEVHEASYTSQDIIDLGRLMLRGESVDNPKVKNMGKPHKRIQKFIDKHQETISAYGAME